MSFLLSADSSRHNSRVLFSDSPLALRLALDSDHPIDSLVALVLPVFSAKLFQLARTPCIYIQYSTYRYCVWYFAARLKVARAANAVSLCS